jgi:hypothetical protein
VSIVVIHVTYLGPTQSHYIYTLKTPIIVIHVTYLGPIETVNANMKYVIVDAIIHTHDTNTHVSQ